MQLQKIIERVLRNATEKKENEALSGGMTDGGYRHTCQLVTFYKYGYDNIIPPEWEEIRDQIQNESEPEYEEYLRLKKKFE